MSPTLLKSPKDNLIYKYIVLENGLKAVLISDPTSSLRNQCNDSHESHSSDSESSETCESSDSLSDSSSDSESPKKSRRHKPPKVRNCAEKLSAMAVVVRSGSFSDPKTVQGLAHLVEHVITMGSEMFPQENDLDSYLTSRGGYQNAYTEYEYTLFEIEVQRNHFYGALQRLAHCFISPLLSSDSIEREIKPVNTEFMEAMSDDEVRLEQILNNVSNKEHPFNCFAWGNQHSLQEIPEKNGTDTQKCVKEFVDKYYTSDNIHVVLQCQESIETLEKWVKELFSQIKPSKDRKPEKEFENPFKDNPNFNRLYLVEPHSDLDQMVIMWSLPPIVQHFKKGPLDYLAHIIGHEGRGSLISFLRRESLALELSAGVEESGFSDNRISSMFFIQIKLTDFGNKNIDSVIEYVFEYLKLLETIGPQKWFFNEFKQIEENRFKCREEETAIDWVKKIAINLNNLPIEYVLRGNKLYLEFDKQLIEGFLDYLKPENACFVQIFPNIFEEKDKTIETEEWFRTKYKVMDVPKEWLTIGSKLKEDSNRFHFPERNPFIATDFTLKTENVENSVEDSSLYPIIILDNNRLKVWHKLDSKFKLPKAIIKLHLICPHIYNSAETVVMNDLFIEIMNHRLNEETYAATLAGLHWRLKGSASGLTITVNGYNDKLNTLLETIITKMIEFKVDSKEFLNISTNLAKNYHNFFIDPSTLCRSLRLTILGHRFVNSVERRTVIESIDEKKFNIFLKTLFSDFYIEALIQGNFTKEESIQLMIQIEHKFGLNKQKGVLEEPDLLTAEIPNGEHICRVMSLSSKNKNSSICNYYQLCPADIHLQCLVTLLSSIMEEPSFNHLRTKEGLGYQVSSHEFDTNGISGYGISVNSCGNEFDCSFVENRIENFLKSMVDHISNMSEETFKSHIYSIIIQKKTPDLQLNDEFSRNWSEIISFCYCFDRLIKEVKCLESINFKEFKEWSSSQLLSDVNNKRKLSVQIVGNGNKSMTECLLIDGKQLETSKINENQWTDDTIDTKQSLKKFKLTFLKSKNDNKNSFIEDINSYKKTLKLFPSHKVIQ